MNTAATGRTVSRREAAATTDQLFDEVIRTGKPIFIEDEGRALAVLLAAADDERLTHFLQIRSERADAESR